LSAVHQDSRKKRRSYWLKQLHHWHWISSAVCLVGLLLFTVTGVTLNHAADIEAKPQVSTHEAQLPPELLAGLGEGPRTGKRGLPKAASDWIMERLSVDVSAREAEWSDSEVYVSLPRPGGDAWLTIDRRRGEIVYEVTSRGWISYANDLHKARNTGLAWRLFIDLFAAACLVFTLTGLVLLQLHSHNRPATWPVVGLGFAVPLLVLILLVH
jgi:hypothetical protein